MLVVITFMSSRELGKLVERGVLLQSFWVFSSKLNTVSPCLKAQLILDFISRDYIIKILDDSN